MKKCIIFFAAVFAAGAILTSCGKDEQPTISVKLNQEATTEITIDEGASIVVEFSYVADAGIKQIEITAGGVAVHETFPKTDGFDAPNSHKENFTLGPFWIEAPNAETAVAEYVTRVTDANDDVESVTIKITVNSSLGDEQNFSLPWGDDGTANAVINELRGIRGIVEDGTFWIRSTTQGQNFVVVTDNEINSIKSSGRIRALYNNAAEANKYVVIAHPNEFSTFQPVNFISKNSNDEYYLIKWTSMDVDFVNFTVTANFSSIN